MKAQTMIKSDFALFDCGRIVQERVIQISNYGNIRLR